MNIRDLQYLVALAEHQHFSQAAEACFVSQPTLSTQIRKLEDELGVALFERAPRQVMVTPVGEAIVARAKIILNDVEHIRQLARRTQNPASGSIKIGLFPTLAPYLLPHIVPSLHAAYPELELLLVEEKTDVLLERLREGKLDAALLALPLFEDDLVQVPLFSEPFTAAIPNHHPLATRKTIRIEDLHDQPLLLLEEGHCLRDQALDVCTLAGTSERQGFRATSLETLRQMVAAGVGMTLLPKLATQTTMPDIRMVPFAKPAPKREIAMVWRASAPMHGFLHDMADNLCDSLKNIEGIATIQNIAPKK